MVSKTFQNPHTNLHSACRNLKNAKEVKQNLRNNYEITILSECKHLCQMGYFNKLLCEATNICCKAL